MFFIRLSISFLLLLVVCLDGSRVHADHDEWLNKKEESDDVSSQFQLRGKVRQQYRRTQSDISIDLKPIRYCQNKKWWGCKTRGYPHGTFWENAGMSNDNQDKAFFAAMGSVPSSSNIEYIAIFSSGQQGVSGGDDTDNVVSGATAGYKWDTNENPSEPRTVQADSVAAQFYNQESRYLPRSKTLYLTLWDAQFNHLASSGEKTDTLQGYANYLTSKVNWSNIKGVVLVGTSRGGCLALRLGEYLRTNHAPSTTDFAIATVDAVCKRTQSEFGVTSSTVDNPLPTAPSSYKSYEVNMNSRYPYGTRYRHCNWHLAVGDEVTGIGLGIRGLSHAGCGSLGGCALLDEYGEEYYKQQWGDMKHTDAGQDFGYSSQTVDPILSHLDSCKARFGWT